MKLVHNQNKYEKIILALFCIMLLSNISCSEQKKPEGEQISEQTFKANFKNFKDVTFSSYNDFTVGPSKVHFYLLRNNRIAFEFPDFYIGSTSWSFESVKAVSFKDVNKDGLKDVILITEYVTGIGPTGMVPFLVKGVYFQGVGGFTQNNDVSKLLGTEANYPKLKSISSIVKYLKSLDFEQIKGNGEIEK